MKHNRDFNQQANNVSLNVSIRYVCVRYHCITQKHLFFKSLPHPATEANYYFRCTQIISCKRRMDRRHVVFYLMIFKPIYQPYFTARINNQTAILHKPLCYIFRRNHQQTSRRFDSSLSIGSVHK